jgi:hypothetical protein
MSGSAAERAEATLTGGADRALEQASAPPLPSAAENLPSGGQSALLSRTNRVERDLDALGRTRHESRVDGAFLRRLLAWAPAGDTAETAAADDGAAPAPGDVVRIVKREQRPVETGIRSE